MAYDVFEILGGRNFDYAAALRDYNVGKAKLGPQPDVAGTATKSAITSGKEAAAQIPGYLTSMGNIGANIASETAGEVPEDVKRLLAQQGAESGAVTGAASNAAYLRSLGLTSLGLKEQGQKDLEGILGVLPGYNISQNPEFQTSSNLAYESGLQQQVFARQQQQQQFELQQQAAALAAAQKGLRSGGPTTTWSAPTNGWSGSSMTDALGFPNYTTATLPGQTSASGVVAGGGGAVPIAYGPGGGPGTTDIYSGQGVDAPGSEAAYAAWNAWNAEPAYTESSDMDSSY